MTPPRDEAVVVFPPVDVGRGLDLLHRTRDAGAALHAAGRFSRLAATEAGRAVLETFDAVIRDAIDQLARARADGTDATTIRVVLPPREARETVVFARRFYEMIGDPEVMAAVGAAPIRPEDLAFANPYLVHAEASLTAAGL